MSFDNSTSDRKKVPVDKHTYEQLKNFSRFNGLKLRVVLAVLTDLLTQDEILRQRVIEKAIRYQVGDDLKN
jgi:hypothetical protein